MAAGFLDNTKKDTLAEVFPNIPDDVLGWFTRVASCLDGSQFTERLLELMSTNGGLPVTITKTLTDNTSETWEFPVAHGRIGHIATAVDGATIDAASTISVQYSLVASPGANDWKTYVDGDFTGEEVDRFIGFMGVLNRVVWTPNANEDLNVMISL